MKPRSARAALSRVSKLRAPADQWHDETPALEARPLTEARRTLQDLTTEELGTSGLSLRTREQVLLFLRRVTGPDSTYTSIVPDDEGVAVLHWVAGPKSLQVDVSEDGPDYLWTCDEHGSRYVTTAPAIYTIAQRVLAEMASAAVNANPSWPDRMRRS